MLLPHPFAMEMKTMNRNGRKYQNANVTIRFNDMKEASLPPQYQSRAYTYRTQSIRIYGQSFLCCFLYIYIYFPCCVAPFRREAFDTKQAIRRHCVVAFLYSVYVQMSDYSQNSARETSMCLPVYGFITMSHVSCICVYMWVSGNMCVRSFRSSSNS